MKATPLAAALLLSACAAAQRPPSGPPIFPDGMQVRATGVPGQAAGVRYLRVGLEVKAVDAAARRLTIRTPDGVDETIEVAREAGDLGAIAAGDVLHAEYEQGLSLAYQPPGSETVALQGTAVGNPEAGVTAAVVQATVTVTAIDLARRSVEFTGPRGNRYRVTAGPELPLDRLRKGDRLLATYAAALAVRLEKAEPVPSI